MTRASLATRMLSARSCVVSSFSVLLTFLPPGRDRTYYGTFATCIVIRAIRELRFGFYDFGHPIQDATVVDMFEVNAAISYIWRRVQTDRGGDRGIGRRRSCAGENPQSFGDFVERHGAVADQVIADRPATASTSRIQRRLLTRARIGRTVCLWQSNL